MKHVIFLGIICSLLGITACSEDEKLGEIKEWKSEYSLPQGGNTEADAIIMQLHQD